MFFFTFVFSNVVKFATPYYRDVCGYFPRGFGNKKRFFSKSLERFKTLSTYWKKQIQVHEYDTYSSFSVEKLLHPPVFSVVRREQQRFKTACPDNKMFSAFNNKGVSKKCHFFHLSSSNQLWWQKGRVFFHKALYRKRFVFSKTIVKLK